MNNAPSWLLAMLLAALACAGGGYWRGSAAGQAAEAARRDAQTVGELRALAASHQGLIEQANTASAAMRAVLARARHTNEQHLMDFKNALHASAGNRAGCEFDDGIVRQLNAERDRAAAAAAGGLAAAVPGTASGDAP